MAKKILLVDDSASVRGLIRAYLSLHDFEFVEAEDVERALKICRLMPLDLIIADVNMPKVSGIDFVRMVRSSEQEALKAVPILLMSGDKDPELRRRGLDAGANSFVHKPMTHDLLLMAVQQFFPERLR